MSYLLFRFDSVFSRYAETPKEPFIKELEKKESAIASLLVNNINQITKVLLDTPPEKLDEEIRKAEGKLRISLQNNLWATWLAGWQMGTRHGSNEIKEPAKFAEERPLRNTAAERAIRQRNNQLANDVTSSEFKRIKKHLLAAVSPQPGTGEPISRTELLQRINNEIGVKGSRYRRRAQTIARTELTFAYNAGRLETYRESGLVSAVKFYTILDERRCDICASRQGIVIPLDDWEAIAANSAPVHPNCRCIWTPVLKDSPDLEDPTRRIENRSLVPRGALWMGAAILAAVLLGGKQGARQAVEEGANLLDVATAQIISNANVSRGEEVQEASEEEVSEEVEPSKVEKVPVTEEPIPALGIKAKPQLMVGSLDLNTATREELMNLFPGRQLTIRQIIEIIRARSKQPFTSIEDLRNVPGIGDKTFTRIQQLAEGYKLIPLIDPVSIKTPAQLWASNLGLTKKQAQVLFDELRRGAFKDIEDLKQRLKGQGFGEKTIENLKNRSAIVKREVTTAVRVTQSVGEDADFIPTVSSGATTPSSPSLPPTRTPAPYSYTPPQIRKSTSSNSKVFDDLNNQTSQLQKATDDFLDASVAASDAKLKAKTNVFDKSLNSIISEGEKLADNLQLNTQGVSESLDKVREWDRRLGSLEENYQKLFDPTQPNYFEEAPQIISQIRAQLKQTRNKLEGTRNFNERTIAQLEAKLDAAEQKLTKLKQTEDITKSQARAEALRSESKILGDRILAMEREVSQIPPGRERSQAWLELSRLKAQKADLDTRIKSAGELLDDSLEILRSKASDNSLNAVRSASGVEDALNTLDAIAQRIESLPVTKSQLNDVQRDLYERSVKVRTVQRQANKQLRQFRQSQGIATRNLEASAQNNLDLYNRYDEQFKNFEQSTSPVVNRLYNEINDDIAFLNSLPQGTVPIFLNNSKWQGGKVPPELAIQFPDSNRTRLQLFSQEVVSRYNRVKRKIKQIKERSEFQYIDTNGQKYTFDDVLVQAESNLQQWQQLRDANLNPNNIGSSNNRLDSLWRNLQKARKVGDEQEVIRLLSQFSADDAFGYARRTLLSLGEWDKAYGDLLKASTQSGEVIPIAAYQRFQDAQELLLQEIGQARINTSQIIENAYNDARDIYERIRSDRFSVPSFEINGKQTQQQNLLQQMDEFDNNLKQLSTQKEITTTPDKQLQKAFDDGVKQNADIQSQIDALTQEIAEGRKVKRNQKELDKLQAIASEQRANLKQIQDEIKSRNLTEQERSLKQQIRRDTEQRKARAKRIEDINREILKIESQINSVGGIRARRLQQRLDNLKAQLAMEIKLLDSQK